MARASPLPPAVRTRCNHHQPFVSAVGAVGLPPAEGSVVPPHFVQRRRPDVVHSAMRARPFGH